MEMQQVRYFVALANTLNFTRAAEQCHITQPVLTRAIKALEHEFGGELIRREGRTTHLTDLGHQMLPLLKQCYDSALSAKSLAKSVAKGEVRSLTLGLSKTVDLDLLQQALSELFRVFHDLRLRLRRGTGDEIHQMLKSGDIEMAITSAVDSKWDRLDSWPMFSESFEIVVGSGHRLAMLNESEISMEALRNETFLVHNHSEMAEEEANGLINRGITLDRAHHVDSDSDLATLVESNVGIALAPASMLRKSRLARFRLNDIDLRRTVSVYGIAGRQRTPEVSALLNLIRTIDWVDQIH